MNKDYKFVYLLVELALIFPVATATVERIFSTMKTIKTEFRNKMGNDWLNHRMICYIEREIFASIKDDDILYHWQDLKNQLQKLPPHGSNPSGIFHIQLSFSAIQLCFAYSYSIYSKFTYLAVSMCRFGCPSFCDICDMRGVDNEPDWHC
jgi:hypothetical protein